VATLVHRVYTLEHGQAFDPTLVDDAFGSRSYLGRYEPVSEQYPNDGREWYLSYLSEVFPDIDHGTLTAYKERCEALIDSGDLNAAKASILNMPTLVELPPKMEGAHAPEMSTLPPETVDNVMPPEVLPAGLAAPASGTAPTTLVGQGPPASAVKPAAKKSAAPQTAKPKAANTKAPAKQRVTPAASKAKGSAQAKRGPKQRANKTRSQPRDQVAGTN